MMFFSRAVFWACIFRCLV